MKNSLLAFITGLLICLFLPIGAFLQNADGHITVDTVEKRSFKKLDIFPAISYSPETSLTFGVIGIKYFDFSRDNPAVPLSNAEFLAIYTLDKQTLIETRWEVFGPENNWRTRGEAIFNRFPDRNYGIGNKAGALVVEFDSEGVADTLNYLYFDSDRIKFSPVVLRKIRPDLYLGPQYDMEYLFRMKLIPEDYILANEAAQVIDGMAIDGLRSGLGFQVLYDTRDKVMNPMRGSLVELNNLWYGKYIGSDFAFTRLHVDARQYLNTYANHTLALRLVGSFEFTDDEIPIRALSRVGGHKFIRGYFRGTYQDHHLAAFETEYRLPFWREGADSKLWQVWKRLGVVGFVSGAQVFHNASEFSPGQFNLAVGGGLRILFNPESRVNIRIDYAVGLRKGSAGIDKRQSGLYFFLGEAF